MKTLLSLLENLTDLKSVDSSIRIESITNNSRNATKNSLFLAYPGEKVDGRKYIVDAIHKGATAICYEPSIDYNLPEITIPAIPVKNLKTKQSDIAARFYDFPSTKVPVIGVTGTNGKTSVTHFIAQCLDRCGVIGTMGYGMGAAETKTQNTTPDGLQLQTLFAELIGHGAKAIAMEVSSHALAQQRVNDVLFHTAVFTNLTQDHLDYHGSMEDYRDAKALLFQHPGLKNAVINIDDDAGKYYVEKCGKINIITYSQQDANADIFITKCTSKQNGFDIAVKTPWGNAEFHLPLIGEFNIQNVLSVLGVLGILKIPFDDIIKKLSQLKTVRGRMQLIHAENKPHVIIDYAHTPDALEKALQSVRSHCSGKLICVFGCGGDRDKTKRPLMGGIADRLADSVIITNDNPRSENPDRIAQDILQGVKNKNNCTVELDRVLAIQKAIQSAEKNDWVLIAGKGHETEQIIGEQAHHHDDYECVMRFV